MQILHAAVLYFLLVFGAGFILGTVRVLVMVPQLGERAAELVELPVMLVATVLAARWIVLRRVELHRLSSALSLGFLALGILLCAELAVGVGLRGMSPAAVFLDRDPVAGAAYYAALMLFAVMPAILTRSRLGSSRRHTG